MAEVRASGSLLRSFGAAGVVSDEIPDSPTGGTLAWSEARHRLFFSKPTR